MKKIWDWYYGKASIRKKLIISYLILVILPILVLGMYSYYVSKKNLIRQTKHTILTVCKMIFNEKLTILNIYHIMQS